MSVIKEKMGNGYIDEEGDLKPYADVQSDLDYPFTDNASISQGMANLEARRAAAEREEQLNTIAEADAQLAREQAVINAGLENPGVYMTLEERYQDELNLMNIISGANQRGGKTRGVPGGFEVAHKTHKDIADTYGDRLPQVAAGAHRNHVRMETTDPLKVYHAQELIDAGIGHKEEIIFDAQTKMKGEYRIQYYGDEDRDKLRAARRRFLNKKLAEYASK